MQGREEARAEWEAADLASATAGTKCGSEVMAGGKATSENHATSAHIRPLRADA
jgi:hypothetical protein